MFRLNPTTPLTMRISRRIEWHQKDLCDLKDSMLRYTIKIQRWYKISIMKYFANKTNIHFYNINKQLCVCVCMLNTQLKSRIVYHPGFGVVIQSELLFSKSTLYILQRQEMLFRYLFHLIKSLNGIKTHKRKCLFLHQMIRCL